MLCLLSEAAVVLGAEVVSAAVDRYKELCEGRSVGECTLVRGI